MFFILTDFGRNYLHANGVPPALSQFVLGSGFGYLPSSSQTALRGVELYRGVPSPCTRVDSSTWKCSIFIDYNVYAFSFGEVLLKLNDIVFAVGTTGTSISKSQLDGISAGSSLVVDCYISQNGAGDFSVYDDLASSSTEFSIHNVGSLDRLPPASGADPNIYAVASPFNERESMLAVSNNALWSFTDYSVYTDKVSILAVGNGYLEFPYSEFITSRIPDPAGAGEGSVIVQFLDGINVGTVRVISSLQLNGASTARYTYISPLTALPSLGDSVRIYVQNVRASRYWNFLSGIKSELTSSLANSLIDYPPIGGVRRDSSTELTQNFNLYGFRGINLADPVDPTDAVNSRTLQTYVGSQLTTKTHNSLVGLQGAGNEYFHLNQTQYTYLSSLAAAGLPSASTSVAGIVQLSSDAETAAGITGLRAVTPSSLLTSIASVTTNSLQTALLNRMRQLNPLVQTGTGAPTGSTASNPSLYIDITDPLRPESYAYNVPNATWYKVGAAKDPAVTGTSLSITGGGASSLSGTLSVGGNTTLNGTLVTIGATTLNGTLAAGATTIAGTLNVTGGSTLSTLNVTSTTGTNASYSGALSVTGTTTLGALTAGAVTASSGNVSGTLTVAGNTTLNGASNTIGGDVTLGTTSGNTINVVGTLALAATTTIDSVHIRSGGGSNTFVGPAGSYSKPGNAVTTGTNNVALGAGALDSTVSPSDMVVIGANACGVGGTYTNSVVLGKNSGGSSATSPSIIDSVFIGGNAGNSASATDCVFVGASSGGSVTGSSNVGVGRNTLLTLTSGIKNVALGTSAGYSIGPTVNYTVLIGGGAGAAVTADGNIAIGYSALAVATSGVNTAIGYRAGIALTTGTGNTLIGYNAGTGGTTMGSTVAIGNSALSGYTGTGSSVVIGTFTNSATSGFGSSVVIGSDIDSATMAGLNSVTIGTGAGAGGTTGSNVIIGYQAFGSAASSGSGSNVAIGYMASKASATGRSQTVAIGALATTASSQNVAIGYNSACGAVSTGSIIVGAGCTVNSQSCVVLGTSSTVDVSSDNAFILGSAVGIAASCPNVAIMNFSSASVTAANVLALGTSLASFATANTVTIGNNAHTAYRMYAASWTNISDGRDKTEIAPLKEGLDLIEKLEPVSFRWNYRDGTGRKDKDSGFIAQDVLAAITEEQNEYLGLVDTSEPDQLMLSASKLIPVMVNAIKELSAQLATTKQELAALKQQLGA